MIIFCNYVYDHLIKALPELSGNYLEIGVFNGAMVGKLANDFPARSIYAIDPFTEDGHTCKPSGCQANQKMSNVRNMAFDYMQGKNNIIFFEMTSKEFSEKICDDKFCVDANISAVLIDGSHWEDNVLSDAKMALKLIGQKKGIIYFDDTYLPDVNKVYNNFLSENQDVIAKIEHLVKHEDGTVASVALYIN